MRVLNGLETEGSKGRKLDFFKSEYRQGLERCLHDQCRDVIEASIPESGRYADFFSVIRIRARQYLIGSKVFTQLQQSKDGWQDIHIILETCGEEAD
jgi:hypothetical protein